MRRSTNGAGSAFDEPSEVLPATVFDPANPRLTKRRLAGTRTHCAHRTSGSVKR